MIIAYIVSCRVASYKSSIHGKFVVVELANFDDTQIKQFIYNWFSSETDRELSTAEKCWSTLKEEQNKSAKELAQTPLLLTFLCLNYGRHKSFSAVKFRLYRRAIIILIEDVGC